MKMIFYIMFSLGVGILIMLLSSLISFSVSKSLIQKSSPFECGFSPYQTMGVPFSMPFFLISLMFLLFDVEVLLVCFFPLVDTFYLYFSFLVFYLISIICGTVFYEWQKGVLVWL